MASDAPIEVNDVPEGGGEEVDIDELLDDHIDGHNDDDVDPRMAQLLAAAETGDLGTLCSLFEQVEASSLARPRPSPSASAACLTWHLTSLPRRDRVRRSTGVARTATLRCTLPACTARRPSPRSASSEART